MSDFSIHRSWLRARGRSEVDATMCELKIIVADRAVTEYSGEHDVSADHVEVPAYFFAEWLAENWWPLLWEPRKSEEAGDDSDFLARHSILTAQHGFALPKILIVATGRNIEVSAKPRFVQFADISFRRGGNRSIPRKIVQSELTKFVTDVAGRLSEQKIHGTDLQEEWSLITGTRDDEIEFCKYMGALGLSPYFGNDVIEGVLDRLADTLNSRLIMDLCLASTPEEFERTAGYAELAIASTDSAPEATLEPLTTVTAPSENFSIPAWRVGVQAATRVRSRLGIKDLDPGGGTQFLDALCVDPTRAAVKSEQPRDESHVVGAVQRNRMTARLALLQRNEVQRRFAAARAVYSAWTAEHENEGRLLTQAVTRDQQASRAFAAEMMAPVAYLKKHARGSKLHQEQVFEIAGALHISADLVRKQAQNNGLTILRS
jgi:hypothetical protein